MSNTNRKNQYWMLAGIVQQYSLEIGGTGRQNNLNSKWGNGEKLKKPHTEKKQKKIYIYTL